MDGALAPSVRVYADLAAASEALAERIAEEAVRAVAERGRFRIALSGGSTPVPLFRLLAGRFRHRVPWERAEFFWADERAVPPSDPRSNFGLAERELLDPIGADPAHVHRIRGEWTPDRAAGEYAQLLRQFESPASPEAPATLLDLAVLGVGPDGHTASLFPGSALLEAAEPLWVGVEPHSAQPPTVPRVSLTLPALARTGLAAFVVAGAEKRAILDRVLSKSGEGPALPAARVRSLRPVEWFADRASRGLGPA